MGGVRLERMRRNGLPLPPPAAASNLRPRHEFGGCRREQRHVAYWQGLLNREVALAFGPVFDPEGPWGLRLLDLEDEQAARAIGASDPAVESGTCTCEVVPMELMRPG